MAKYDVSKIDTVVEYVDRVAAGAVGTGLQDRVPEEAEWASVYGLVRLLKSQLTVPEPSPYFVDELGVRLRERALMDPSRHPEDIAATSVYRRQLFLAALGSIFSLAALYVLTGKSRAQESSDRAA